MVKTSGKMEVEVVQNMRGGNGSVTITHILSTGEYNGKARMLAKILLKPGCSIGYHRHVSEEEIIYMIAGHATYNDNGNERLLNEGECAIATSGQIHSIANNTDKDVVFMATVLTY